MFQFYLPIAEMSVNAFLIAGLGAAVGFVTGMFGVGGGFLMTPFLIFSGIPPAVAVATGATHIVASSVAGMATQVARKAVDFKMGLLLVAGGVPGTFGGVWLVSLLQQTGQIDLIIKLSYVVLLGSIGLMMLNESLRTILRSRAGTPAPKRTSNHNWVHFLPFKMRFRASKLYISALPPLGLGLFSGFLAGVMGIGGGFIMVPAMLYLLGMSASSVVGTSLFQIIFVTATATLLHATATKSVDIVLALLLLLGGVAGAQAGVRAAQKLRPENLRLALALIVLAVALRLFFGLTVEPADRFSLYGPA